MRWLQKRLLGDLISQYLLCSIVPNKKPLISKGDIGGRTRTRTLDPLIKSQLLYQLSYAPAPIRGNIVRSGGIGNP